MAWLHKSRNPSLLAAARQPERPAVVDWSHPLAQDLTTLYVPSIGLNNLTGLGPDLLKNTATTFVVASGGIGLNNTAANMSVSGPFVSNAAKPTQKMTMFWVGRMTAQSSSNMLLIGVNHNNTNTTPFTAYSLEVTAAGALTLNWNDGTNLAQLVSAGATVITGATVTYAATLDLAGQSAILYKNGLQITSSIPAIASVAYAATAYVDFCGAFTNPTRFLNGAGFMGALWSRVLAADEIAALHAEPYSMLIPEG